MKYSCLVLFLAALAVAPLATHAAEAPGEIKDTRPVKKDPVQAPKDEIHFPGDGHDHGPHDGHDHGPHDGHNHGPANSAVEQSFPELKGKLDFREIEMIAVQEGGRKKPLHTYASENIEQLVGRPLSPMQLSGWFAARPYVKDKFDTEGKRKVEATDLFLSLWFNGPKWVTSPIILVQYGPLKRELGLPQTEKHFSAQRLAKSDKLMQLVEGAQKKRQKGFDDELTDLEREAEIVEQRLRILANIMRSHEQLAIIPHPDDSSGTWLTLSDFQKSFGGADKPYYSMEQANTLFDRFNAVLTAYDERDAEKFTKASKELRATLVALSPSIYPSDAMLKREVAYNDMRPFGKAWVFYLFAALVGAFAIRASGKKAYYISLALAVAGFVMHTYGFTLRCIIAGRPPVSNMYESVIWVGFGAVVFGLVFEWIYKKRYFAVSGAGAGFLCLVLMDLVPAMMGNANMPGFEAKISPLVPVLRDNFWLTVHVLTITLSYAAFMLAWVLGHVTLGSVLISPQSKRSHFELHQFVYRALQVGVLLLAVGTILGGVWAYYSWGRFWGWDPKETWAFIALMCYLFVLHGRFAGWWGNFGLSVGSVVCFQSIVMAWYGVNFVLGKGLHSYGTGSGGERWVIGTVIIDALFMIAAVARHLNYKPAGAEEVSNEEQLASTDPIQDVRKELTPEHGAGE